MLLPTGLVVPGAATVKPMANAAVGSPLAPATATADGWRQDNGKVIQRAGDAGAGLRNRPRRRLGRLDGRPADPTALNTLQHARRRLESLNI